jgi:hypothetical protein
MLRDNGRLMYVVDTVDGREYAFDSRECRENASR